MGDEELPENIEEIIERKVQERVQEELESQSAVSSTSESGSGSENFVDRRGFLKTLGVGAGVLTLSSIASGWSIIQPSGQGLSDISADRLDGSDASDFVNVSGDTMSGTLNMSNNEITNLKIENRTSDPGGLSGVGQIWYRTDL